MTIAPPNWYTDPDNVKGYRYWDGEQWTDHYQTFDGDDIKIIDEKPKRYMVNIFILSIVMNMVFIAALVLGFLDRQKLIAYLLGENSVLFEYYDPSRWLLVSSILLSGSLAFVGSFISSILLHSRNGSSKLKVISNINLILVITLFLLAGGLWMLMTVAATF